MLNSDCLTEDLNDGTVVRIVRTITTPETTWAVTELSDGFTAAYPGQNYVQTYGEVCLIARDLTDLRTYLV